MRKKISEFTLKLQNQNSVPLWALANDNVLFSAALNQNYPWKNKSYKISRLMKISNTLKVPGCLIFLIGFYKIVLSLEKIRKKKLRDKNTTVNYKKIFVGHGANAEEFIFEEYVKKNNSSALRINVINLDGLEKITTPSLFLLLKLLFQNSYGLSHKIKKLSFDFNLNLLDFLVVAALNIGEYVFFSEFFRIAKLKGINEVTFLALHVSAHSCAREKLKMVYWSHGLIKLSILMIKANHIAVLTLEEKNYLISLFKGEVDCSLLKNYKPVLGIKKNSIIFMSPELLSMFPEAIKENVFSFLEWCKNVDFQIILRPSPKTSQSDLLDLKKQLPGYNNIDEFQIDFEERLKTIQPKFVAGLNTTGLFVALSLEILPICFCDPHVDDATWNMIYPMKQRALFWPKDRCIIEEAICSDIAYNEHLLRLRNALDCDL